MSDVFSTVLSIVSSLQFAAAPAKTVKAAAPAAASECVANIGAESGVEFLATGKPGFLQISGKGSKPTGTLKVLSEPSATQVTGTITVPVDAFVTGIDKRDEHMKKKYLETGTYPTSEFELTSLNLTKPVAQNFSVEVPFHGMLSLHGIKKEISGNAKVSNAAGALSADTDFSILISDFKIPVPSFLGITVADKVDVKAHIVSSCAVHK